MLFFRTKTPPSPAIDLFTLRTGRGNWLAVEGAEVVMQEDPPPAAALYCGIPRGSPQNSFLIAADGRSIEIEGDGFRGPAISGRIRRIPGGRVELRHPIASVRHLGVVTGAPVGRANRVMFDRVGDKLLDRFHPVPADPQALAAGGRAVLRDMARAVPAPMDAHALLALLRAGIVPPALAEAVLRLLPAEQLQEIASAVMQRPADLALLQRGLPRDVWVQTALPALLAWRAAGRPPTRRAVSPAQQDHVAILQSGDLRPQVGLALHALARRTISPRRTACVVATARNEGPYLLDWIAHHRAIGFDHLIIYSNDNDDGSDDLLGRLADHNEITWVQNELSRNARPQWKAYGHAFKMLPDPLDFRWTMVLDLDEYVSFRPDLFATVADMIGWHEHQPVDALALRWLTYVGGRQDVWRDQPSTQRFIRREKRVSPLFKSLVRSNMFWDSHCHFPFPTLDQPFTYRLEDGGLCHHMGKLKGEAIPQDAVSADHAWVAHHVLRSAGEALAKIFRGDALWAADARPQAARLESLLTRFVAMADDPDLIEDWRTQQCAPGFAASLNRLRALPGIAPCDRRIKQDFAARLRRLTHSFLDAPVDLPDGQAIQQFRAILRAQHPAEPACLST
jgi:hypothetical protein